MSSGSTTSGGAVKGTNKSASKSEIISNQQLA